MLVTVNLTVIYANLNLTAQPGHVRMLQVCRLDGAHPAPHNRFLNQQFESLKRIRIQSTQLTSFQYSRQVSLIGVTLFCQNWAKIGKFILYFSMTYVILEPPPSPPELEKPLIFSRAFSFGFTSIALPLLSEFILRFIIKQPSQPRLPAA